MTSAEHSPSNSTRRLKYSEVRYRQLIEDSTKLTRFVLLSFLVLLVIDANPQEPKSQAP
jgi:hypothetical protein